MPVKRRTAKHRGSSLEEAKAWGMAFCSGHDFLGELVPYGFTWGDDDAVQEAAEEAWQRVGALYLDAVHDRSLTPWALEQFGEPHAS